MERLNDLTDRIIDVIDILRSQLDMPRLLFNIQEFHKQDSNEKTEVESCQEYDDHQNYSEAFKKKLKEAKS